MPQYLAPGVFIEEIPAIEKSIVSVGTTTAAFIGAGPDKTQFLNEPRACHDKSEFDRLFDPDKRGKPTNLAHAVYGFFDNGGTRCFVVNTGPGDEAIPGGIDACEAIDEIAMIAAPGCLSPVVYEALLSSCERMGDRFAIMDAPPRVDQVSELTEVATVQATPKPDEAAAAAEEGGGTRRRASRSKSKGLRPRTSARGFGAFYFPWLCIGQKDGSIIEVPPSGHMAGVYARTDIQFGVHKAPANCDIKGIVGITQQIKKAQHEVLNPAGVNVIRSFGGTRGILVWGAGTLADQVSEWRYVPVRRLFNQIEESIAQATNWIVFQPNDMTLWKSVTRDITAYLLLQWRAGALMGATPAEAFFVNCNAETNPPESIDAGRLVAEIGIAPVKPAEFIIFRITQKPSGATVEMAA